MIENTFGKIQSVEEAMKHIEDHVRLMVGGFGGIGSPPLLCRAIFEKNVQNITLICNDAGFPQVGVGPIVCNGQVKKMITTHIGSNPFAGRRMNEKLMEVEFIPQGIFYEQIRAAGMGLGGILEDIGMETMIAAGKSKIELDGKEYILAPAISADVAVIYAKKADPYGNLVYEKTARGAN
ncbi:MAG TPA: 3-oxoacid CoA-transferase subunit A, partial [Lachnospiraceae bacterium]|nr:3-oxoacid CoA-transferase subunit A [Lachnospiraceae bacterium]